MQQEFLNFYLLHASEIFSGREVMRRYQVCG